MSYVDILKLQEQNTVEKCAKLFVFSCLFRVAASISLRAEWTTLTAL